MPIQMGDSMPAGSFLVMNEEGPGELSTDSLFGGKKVVLFSLPGAFTPTCSAAHLPGFVDKADEIRAAGVDEIACMSVNDVHVMHAWGEAQNANDTITMLADGNGDYARAIGLEVDLSAASMGVRGKRFAAIVDDGRIIHLAVEEPGKFEVSSADAVLRKL